MAARPIRSGQHADGEAPPADVAPSAGVSSSPGPTTATQTGLGGTYTSTTIGMSMGRRR
jgi:hypothetical protein